MHYESDNIEIVISNETKEIIEETIVKKNKKKQLIKISITLKSIAKLKIIVIILVNI